MQNYGYCTICEDSTLFIAYKEWLRDYYVCSKCGSAPRQRAVLKVIKENFPSFKTSVVHESSPGSGGSSLYLENNCENYIKSQYFGKNNGEIIDGFRSENLEDLTFADNSIDLHVSQDVLEHVFVPEKAFAEIARTLKPGGMHIFTVPIVNKFLPTTQRAQLKDNGDIIHILEESYHGNPIGDGKALVTYDWGYDICDVIFKSSGLFTKIIEIENIDLGIKAEYIDVFVTYKNI